MSLKQVDKLYRKMIVFDSEANRRINSGVRTELFHVIMEDIEKMQKKVARLNPASEECRNLDAEMRKLLLKEIQIIIDDYMIAQQNGTLDLWRQMYGDIGYYIKNFYLYRKGEMSDSLDQTMNKYGFFHA
jgi:hypothetical protein